MSAPIVESLLAASQHALAALALKATLALVAALLLIRVAARASASLRHLLAAATFGLLLLLPLAAMLVPARVIAVPPPASAAARPAESTAIGAAAPAAEGAPAPAMGISAAAIGAGVYGVYVLGGAGFVLARLLGILRLHGVRRRADVSLAATRLANDSARALGLPGGIEVAVSSELAVPVTFGWTHPVILLPAETKDWDEQELARAVRHELEHIARGDWATHVVARLGLALYWPHPFAWLLWRRLRLEAERACDDAVVRGQGQAEPYAEQLVSLARRLRGHGGVPALSMATRSNLGVRIDAILDGRLRRAPRSRVVSLAVTVSALACLLAIAPVRVIGAALPPAEDPLEFREGNPLDMALLEASERGDLRAMRHLMDKGARADAVLHGDGSPLIAAARSGQVEAMQVLIAAGADVNRGVGGDGNPITMAARRGHLEAVRLLLDHGADIDAGIPGDGNALIMAAGDGQVEVVRYLLEKGAALEKVVPGDENPLIHACEGGQAEVVRLLIERGADVNARVWAEGAGSGGEWRTPLSMARRNRHHDVVEILRAANARE